MSFNQEEFNQFILENQIVGTFTEPITLKSGRQSHWYVNWRDATNNANTLTKLALYITAFIEEQGLRPDSIIGVPEGASKVAVVTSIISSLSGKDLTVPIARGSPKAHGLPRDKYFIGEPKGRTIVIEDVTTTGGSLRKFIEMLNESKVDIIAAISITNRLPSLQELEKQLDAGFPVFQMSQGADLVKALLKDNEPLRSKIEAELYGQERDAA